MIPKNYLVKSENLNSYFYFAFFGILVGSFFLAVISKFLNSGFSWNRLGGLLTCIVLIWLVFELLFHDYKEYFIYSDKIIVTKPYKRFSLFKKKRYFFELKENDWEELYHFRNKNESILYFRKNRTVQFIIAISKYNLLHESIQKHYPNKFVESNSSKFYPIDVVKAFKKKCPDKFAV